MFKIYRNITVLKCYDISILNYQILVILLIIKKLHYFYNGYIIKSNEKL